MSLCSPSAVHIESAIVSHAVVYSNIESGITTSSCLSPLESLTVLLAQQSLPNPLFQVLALFRTLQAHTFRLLEFDHRKAGEVDWNTSLNSTLPFL